MNRGRLICPFLATLHRLDTRAIETAVGYDPDFRAPKITYPGNVGARSSSRREFPAVDLRCQVEVGKWEAQRQMASGDAPDSQLTLIFHFADLEALSLVDAVTGDALIRVSDRLSAIKRLDGSLVQQIPDPGLFATEPQIGGLGIGGRRNLLIVTFDVRPQGLTTGTG
jgi:hypothetical protein